jgi:hypothetical protein
VKKREPYRKQAVEILTYSTWPCAIALSLCTIGASPAFARSWSYHYQPTVPSPSPAASATEASIPQTMPQPGEQLSTARSLKRAIVSDLAVFVEEQSGRPSKAQKDHSEDLIRQLSLFDPLGSPAALGVFAGLSGYYLGARGEELYDCLSLRKGKILESYLEQYVHSGNAECAQQLGQSFTRPSDALGGYALCPAGEQQKAHLMTLIAELDSAKLCSDSDLAALTARPLPSGAQTR